MNSIFEFSVSKLDYVAISMKIGEKHFWPIFKTFFNNRGKNKDEDEKIWKNEFHFCFSHIKVRLHRTFHKNLRKIFFFEIFIWEGDTRTEVSKGLIRAVLKLNLSLFWIGDDDVKSDECKDIISNKCWTPVQSLRCL